MTKSNKCFFTYKSKWVASVEIGKENAEEMAEIFRLFINEYEGQIRQAGLDPNTIYFKISMFDE